MPKRKKPEQAGEIVTLSSGAQVRFNKIAPGIQQGILQRAQTQMIATGVLASLQKLDGSDDREVGLALMETLGADGLEKLTEITRERNTDLLMWGVTLLSEIPQDTRWLRNLKKSRSLNIDWDLYDVNDTDDVHQLYVRYIAFGSPDDWALFYTHTGVSGELQDALPASDESEDGGADYEEPVLEDDED